jgi:hypothetical protein
MKTFTRRFYLFPFDMHSKENWTIVVELQIIKG